MKREEVLVICGVLFVLAAALLCPILLSPQAPADPVPREFNANVWQTTNHLEDRFAMLNDLKQKYKILGKTPQETYQLLGKPDWELSVDNWISYDLGSVGKDSQTMVHIHFTNNRADKIEVHRDT